MKRIITTIALLMSLGATLYAQLPTFEWRVENGQYVNSTTYSFDVNMYNTGGAAFEFKGGTVALSFNTAWLNGGSLGATANNPTNITYSNYGIPAGQQTGATNTVSSGTAAQIYMRKIIPTVGATLGTSIPANSKVRLFTMTIQNVTSTSNNTPVAFSTTATPNLTWRFNAAPFAGFTYTDGSGNAVTVLGGAAGVQNTNQKFCFTPVYWNGTQWSSRAPHSGADTSFVPTLAHDAVVYTGSYTQSGSKSLRSLDVMSGTTYDVGGANVTGIYGNILINGTFTNTAGEIVLSGSGSKTISGSASKLSTNGIFLSGTGTYTSSLPLEISNRIADGSSGFTLVANAGITLLSTASNTALIGQLAAGTTISGTITAERYIGANGRRWRFLSSPVVGGTTLQWRDNAGSTSGRGIMITGTTGTVDFNVPNPSALRYNEASATGGSNINAKWEAIDGNSALTNGRGYRVFVRGDRTDVPLNSGSHATTIWVAGTYPGSSVSLPVTYNPSLGNGWNLVGNPYPCPIDWNASSGWTKTNVSGTMWIWNPSSNSYGSYDGITIVNSVTRHIASGQAFFVQATGASPVLTASEAVKVSNTPSNMFKTAERNSLRINLVKDATESDETVVRFMDTKSDEFNNTDDVVKPMMNPSVNISSYFGTDKYAMVNYMNTKSMDAKVIPLGASVAEEGTYDLNFDQVDGFDANINIYLKDNYNNTITDLRKVSKYSFNVDAKAESIVDARLELIFVNKTSSIENVLAGRKANMSVYPNPAVDVLNVEITNANFKHSEVSIFNVSGVEVMNNNMIGNKKSLDVQKLSSGVYFVRVSNSETGYSNTVKFVK